MKINLHQHTMKTKSGEQKTRNLDIQNSSQVNQFIENLITWDVGIVAITNHNWFDLDSFNILETICITKNILLLPGIEIDILDENNKRHNLTIVVDNKKKEEWSNFIFSIVKNKNNANSFEINLKTLVESDLKNFKKIYLVPNKQKGGKDLPKQDLEIIKNDVSGLWFFETTQKKSSQILNFKGEPSLYGSYEHDIFNPNYHDLPNIRLNIDSFSNLCNFLKKDLLFLEKQKQEKLLIELKIKPEDWTNELLLPIYKDINIIIGPRGTGKTQLFNKIKENIGKELKKEFRVYEQIDNGYELIIKRLESEFTCPINFSNEVNGINYMIENYNNYDFKEILNSFNQIVKYHKQVKKEKYKCWLEFNLSKNLISHTDNKNLLNQKYNFFKEKLNNLLSVLEIIKENKDKKIYFNEKYNVVLEYINQTIEYEKDLFQKFYCENKSLILTNGIVEEIQNLINGMTNQLSLPGKLNIFKTFNLRSNLLLNFRNIFSWNTVYSKELHKLGEILNNKTLFIKREYTRVIGKKGKYENLGNCSFGNYQKLDELSNKIVTAIWNNSLQEKINEFINFIKENNKLSPLKSEMFIWFKNIIENQNGILHTPSPGEKQIINLTNYLEQDQEYYFLDEPEKSLDNNFVNDVLVRKLNEKANQGKTIVIVTHNANLGIRTSPYLTIYRKIPDLESSENETFLGHAFIDKMSDIKKQEANLFWTEVCEKILEGGSEDFNDRSNYYRK